MTTLRRYHEVRLVLVLTAMFTSGLSAAAGGTPAVSDSTPNARRSLFALPQVFQSRFFGTASKRHVSRVEKTSGKKHNQWQPGSPSRPNRETQERPPSRSDSSREASSPDQVDGTWREENGFVIINLNGQELRLAKSTSSPPGNPLTDLQATAREAVVPAAYATVNRAKTVPAQTGTQQGDSATSGGGTATGRLLHRGRPVTECKVSLVPLTRSFGSYHVNENADPHSAVTSANGSYTFSNVPRGPYKLFWLPKGERQWIRRIEFRPDVVIRTGETTHVKEIRTSLRTLN